jgi:hypothetical protein
MKNNIYISKVLIAAVITAGFAFNVSSCKKDNSAATVTEADAAQLTTDAVTPTSGGMVDQLNRSVTTYNAVTFSCGVQKDSSFAIASTAGASPSYSYNLMWNYNLTCSGVTPSQLTFNFTGAGSYNGPLMSSSDNSKGGFVLTGLGASSTQYIFNTTYSRTGTTISKILKQNTFNSVISITGTNVAVDKTSQEIVSGTATVSIQATSSSGKSFTFNGTITFLGNKTANLVLNSGKTYAIQWS